MLMGQKYRVPRADVLDLVRRVCGVDLTPAPWTKADIKSHVEREFGYHLSERLDDIRERYSFDVSCQGSVPQSIIAFLEANGFEDAVRNAISLGGDADTMACIAGGIAEAFFGGMPDEIASRTLAALDERLRVVVSEFRERFADRLTRSST
jgi:ADP-ribosylglycohydrolase